MVGMTYSHGCDNQHDGDVDPTHMVVMTYSHGCNDQHDGDDDLLTWL